MGAINLLQRAFSGFAKSIEYGLLFPKAIDIDSDDFDDYLGTIDPALFKPQEVFGGFKVVNSTQGIYAVEVELMDGQSRIYKIPAWGFENIMGRRILSAGTGASVELRLYAGQ